MDRFIFHGVDHDHNNISTYTKDRKKALKPLGPQILEATLPSLSSNTPSTGSEIPEGLIASY